jgi:hypothetical protein
MRGKLMDELENLVERGAAKQTTVDGCTQFVFADVFVAGFRYSDGPDIMPYLQSGEKLDLIAEPLNPHDEWAVRIEHHKSRIGYVPRSIDRAVSMLLQEGVAVQAEIVGVNADAASWECVSIKLTVELK